jgi:hypothetical protein
MNAVRAFCRQIPRSGFFFGSKRPDWYQEALRLKALRKVSSIRDCQPDPVDLK